MLIILIGALTHWVGGNRKRSCQSTNADQKPLETVFSIAICRQSGDKWQSKTLFLMIFDLHSSIVLTFLIVTYPLCLRVRNGWPKAYLAKHISFHLNLF